MRAQLTRERILATAIRIADREGFAAVTLRRIAAQLDVHVTSLYNHVPTRQAVTDGMIEALLGEAKLPAGDVDWRLWVREFVSAMGTLARTHTGAFAALQHGSVQGPEASATFEAAVGSFRRAGFPPEDAYCALKSVTLAALGFGAEQAAIASGRATRTDVRALPAERFPNVHEISPVVDDADTWTFLTECLVAGLQTMQRRARKGGRT